MLVRNTKVDRDRTAKVYFSEVVFNSDDPYSAIQSGKIMAKAWSKELDDVQHIEYGQSFILKVVETYWAKVHENAPKQRSLPLFFRNFSVKKLDVSVAGVAEAIGLAASKLSVIHSSYLIGTVYTSVLPEITRAKGGIFYTPPALALRLIQMADNAGVDWSVAKILDPACGGGAFLAPICVKIMDEMRGSTPTEVFKHIQANLRGWEIDPFAGWLSQVFVEVAIKDVLEQTGKSLKPIVTICNSLNNSVSDAQKFDLVIGNPPFGKIKLTDEIKSRFQKSLYGHPNLYGLFTHLALNLVRKSGVIAYLTPTSYLSGEYFKKLRQHLRVLSSPVELDFVSVRKGVFDEVLQETMLTILKAGQQKKSAVKINQLCVLPNNEISVTPVGAFFLPDSFDAPWIFPRMSEQKKSAKAMTKMSSRLVDWGYRVSTGPLVWNRHKSQLSNTPGKNTFPIIWAEAVTANGTFILKPRKLNHSPYFQFKEGDEWLVTNSPCILLQRTTSKEQSKRLIATTLPKSVCSTGVVIENHLNMLVAVEKKPAVPLPVLCVFLNSRAVNEAFRTISGSVAISAYELESFPLPSVEKLAPLIDLINKKSSVHIIEQACDQLYTSIV